MKKFSVNNYLPYTGQYCDIELIKAVEEFQDFQYKSIPINLNKAISFNFGRFIE